MTRHNAKIDIKTPPTTSMKKREEEKPSSKIIDQSDNILNPALLHLICC